MAAGSPVRAPRRGGSDRRRADPRILSSSLPDGQDISRLIGRAYDAALGNEDWLELVGQLSQMLGGTYAVLHPSGTPTQPDVAIRYNSDPAFIPLYNAHYHRLVPLTPRLLSQRTQTTFIFSREMPEPAFTCTEYYNDYLRPQGIHSWLSWADVDDRGLHAHLSLWRPRQRPGWDEPELRVLGTVGAHLGRALEIQRRLAAVSARRSTTIDIGLIAPQERACLAGVARGASSKLIARQLGLSMHTVNAYLASARRKLNAASRSEAVAMALSAGLIDG